MATKNVHFVYDDNLVIVPFADDTQIDTAFHRIQEDISRGQSHAVFNAADGKVSIRLNYLNAFTVKPVESEGA